MTERLVKNIIYFLIDQTFSHKFFMFFFECRKFNCKKGNGEAEYRKAEVCQYIAIMALDSL